MTLPLIVALFIGMFKVNKLSQQGSSAVIDVAQLIQTNRELSEAIKKMQRYSSQHIVLKEPELFTQYLNQKEMALAALEYKSEIQEDEKLQKLISLFTRQINQLSIPQDSTEFDNNQALQVIEQQFNLLTNINQKFSQRSNELITLHAQDIKLSANKINAVMMNSLLSIPITLIISGVFILLIRRPLKLLSMKIKRLERGHFDKKIHFSGSMEIQEIADALELMRARLHALELQKSSFIRHISHELKTPLAAIREGTELLYDNSVGELNEGQQEVTNILKESVSRLQNLIEDLLDFNIVLDSTSLQSAEKISISTHTEQCLLVRKLDMQSKNLSVVSNIEPFDLKTNAKQLSVILDNILSNAIKYAPKLSSITLSTALEQEHVLISISDEGPGIAEHLKAQVFDAFYQGQKPTDSHIKSSGLGLTIVKELLMRLNGSIELTSNPNHSTGLTVVIRLPYNNKKE